MIADRIDLVSMLPIPGLASTGYCLAKRGSEYLVYLPDTNSVVVDLKDVRGKLMREWFDPATGVYSKPGKIKGGNKVVFKSPFESPDAVLYLRKRK